MKKISNIVLAIALLAGFSATVFAADVKDAPKAKEVKKNIVTKKKKVQAAATNTAKTAEKTADAAKTAAADAVKAVK